MEFRVDSENMEDSGNMEETNEEILKWCREICYSKQYSKYNIEINDFYESWLDGRAFLILIHSQLPPDTRFRFIELNYHYCIPTYQRLKVAFRAAE